MPRPGRMPDRVRSIAIAAFLIAIGLAGCADGGTSAASAPPRPVPDAALPGLLLSPEEIDAVLGTTGIVAHPQTDTMGDHRNLLSNLNCLGVWQVDEAPIYDSSHYKTLRQQLLRSPDSDQWDSLAVQSVVSYRTADAAHTFFAESAQRWSQCTHHTVNVRINDQAMPKWVSGDLDRSDILLAMPYTRGVGAEARSCQRALAVAANVILDIQACRPPQEQPVTAAVDIVEKIEAKLPR